jgi:Protein of unknown function (DUF3341)
MSALVAAFTSESDLAAAVEHCSREGWPAIDTYSPLPVLGQRASSPLPALMFIAGVLGFAAFFLLMTYADVRAFPHNIGGRPPFSWPAYLPIAFELSVLCAMFTGFIGFLVLARLPRLYQPVDELRMSRRALNDRWLLRLELDKRHDGNKARALLGTLNTESIEEIP